MKGLRRITTAVFAFLFILVCSCQECLQVFAGSSDIILDKSSYAEELNTAEWNAPANDVVAQNGKIIFSAESTADTRLITKAAVEKSANNSELFAADIVLKIKRIPEGKKFIVAFALDSIESYYEEAGNIELVFENNNGIKVSMRGFDENGEEIILAKAQTCGISNGSTVKISADATTDMKLHVTVNNKSIYNTTSPLELTGRFGFLQTGGCAVEVSNTEFICHRYDTPENTNVNEDFENGTMNTNALISKAIHVSGVYPCGVSVEEYNGSKVLMFRNTGVAFFGTLYQYSNFEMSFDIPYLLHDAIVDETGAVTANADAGIAVAIGGEANDYADRGYDAQAEEAIIFYKNSLLTLDTGHNVDFTDMKVHGGDKATGYSVKIRVVDTVITVSIKALNATAYTEVLSYKYGNTTPMGYINIWSTAAGNFALDNFSIQNLDADGQVLEVEYKEGFVTGTEDWEYEPMEVIYLENDVDDEAFEWSKLMLYTAIVSVLFIGVCVLVKITITKSKRKEKKANEE